MNALKTTLAMAFLIFSGCATPSLNKNAKEWESFQKSEHFQNEKATFFSRVGDRRFCWDVGLDGFLNSNSTKPDTKCIYPASKLIVQYDDSLLIKSKVLAQNFKQLKILQVISDGLVIQSPNYKNDQVIFIHKTDEENLVDGAFLDESQNFKLYEYVGTYRYQSIMGGSKTVYSFRKVNKKLLEAKKDIKFYDPLREFQIDNQLWKNLGEYPKNRDSFNSK